MVAEGTTNSMNQNEMTLGLVLASVASVVSFVFVLVMCLCCYKPKSDDDSDDLPKIATYQSVSVESDNTKRDDVKLLHKHPWQDPKSKSPHLTRKSINLLKSAAYSLRFERPADKRFVTENVQPDQYSPSSLNKTLGVRNRDTLVPNDLKGSEGGGGSASSSPYHRTLSGESDGAGASALDMVPLDLPDYPSYGEKLGKIQFSLSYNFQEMTLTLKIVRATDLPAKDFSGTSDPYVKILLLPDKKSKLQTNIKRKNLNPRWNEVFAFEGFPYSKLVSRTLYLQVLDYDRFSRDDPIGEVCLPLGDVDLAQGETMWKTLQPCKGHTGKLGELLLSLCYQPTVGRITIVVLKARELKAKDINGLSDPYVKIWLCHEGKKIEKKKTAIKEKNLNPVYNESFIFNVPYERIRQTSLNISVVDYDRMGRNELIGQVVLGSKSGPMEVKHWNEMFAKSRTAVAQWHILKDFG